MTLNLWNPKELEVLQHMCEAYLYGAMYQTDFCNLLIWEDRSIDIERCIDRHYKMWNEKETKTNYEDAARAMAWDLQTLQQKMLEQYL